MSPFRLAALLLSALVASAAAQAAPPRRADLPPVAGEVIVRFKADATTLRKHTLAAQAGPAAVRQALDQRALTLGTRIGRPLAAGPATGERAQVVRASGIDAVELAARIAADPDVEYAVPNGRRRVAAAPNDPLYPATLAGVRPRGPDAGQWYLRPPSALFVSSIDIEGAWQRTRGSPAVVVAVLDTGVRAEHPDLAGRLLPGYDFIDDREVANDGDGRDADPSDPGDWVTAAEAANGTFSDCSVADSSWHGTSTASLVGAATDDGIGMAGTAPGVKVLPVRVLGKCYGNDSDILAGMLWAAGIHVAGVPDNPNPAKVLNMSLGDSGSCNAAYQSTVDQVLARGVVIVAAAGNGGGLKVGVPGNCTGVIAVLALRHAGTKVGFSDLGPQVGIAAPGGNCINVDANAPCLYPILAATNNGTQTPTSSGWTDSYNYTLGTSFSAPLVAGTVGLMFSAQPSLTPEQVRSRLQASARPFPTTGGGSASVAQCRAPTTVSQDECYCNTANCGAGMLDANAAINTQARIVLETAAPSAGSSVTLSAAGSLPALGATVAGYVWSITSSGGIVSGFSGSANSASVSLTPSAAGSFTLQVVVVDSLGGSTSSTQTVTVAAAVQPGTGGGNGGGGGVMAPLWLLALLLATLALHHGRSRERRPGRTRNRNRNRTHDRTRNSL